MIGRPRKPPLFPYPTLFRSIPIAWTTTIPASTLTGRLRPEIGLVAALVAGAALALARLVWRTALKRYTGASGRRATTAAADRKSTRLNSSHDQISYAVFCLQ